MTVKQMERCRLRLEAFLGKMLAPLGRSERQRWGAVYVRGLLLNGERKSVGAIALRLPEANEQNLQQFLSQSPWAWEPVWEQLAQELSRAFPPTAWIIDDTSFPKQGQHSVGVQRQYCGALGKKANCQVAVSLHQASQRGSSPLAWRLYLPESWISDEKRCRQVGVPAPISFRKKWELALDLIDQAFAWGVPRPPVVLADAGYGDTTEFRQGLAQRQLPYAVAVTSQVRVWTEPPQLTPYVPKPTGRPTHRLYEYGEQKPPTVRRVAETRQKRFRSVAWREGTKGAMRSRFLALRVQSAHGYVEGEAPGSAVWLLIEWPPEAAAPTKYFLCDLPASYSLRRLVYLTKERYRVEQDYQQMKEELGLDHFEGRSWTGWHHHVTLVMLAHAFLRFEQRRRRDKSPLEPARSAA
jgi:SRSO17 transposase